MWFITGVSSSAVLGEPQVAASPSLGSTKPLLALEQAQHGSKHPGAKALGFVVDPGMLNLGCVTGPPQLSAICAGT